MRMGDTMRILVIVPFKEAHMARLREAAGDKALVVQELVGNDTNRLRELLQDADAVIGEPAPQLLAEAPQLRWVQMTWAGTDRYTASGIPFPEHMALTNVAGAAYGHIISQYVVGQAIALCQNFPAYVRQQMTKTWRCAGPNASLDDAQVLIFGAGDIGTYTARRLQGFDAHCTGVCRDTTRERPFFERLVTLDKAEDLLPTSDVVINCLPNTPQTVGYLDERRLRRMKKDAILVNVGRGNFVDCMALARVLADGHLRGAALDVTDPEPLPKRHPLWMEPRCVITPHEAGGPFGKSEGTEERICQVCCDNVRRFVANEPLAHRVL